MTPEQIFTTVNEWIEILAPIITFGTGVLITVHLVPFLIKSWLIALEPMPDFEEKEKPKTKHHDDDTYYATFEELFEESK